MKKNQKIGGVNIEISLNLDRLVNYLRNKTVGVQVIGA